MQPDLSSEDEISEEKESSSSSDDDTKELDRKMVKQSALLRGQKQHRSAKIVSAEVASALDRTKVSDRNAAFLLAATAKAFGQHVSSLAVSRTAIRQARLANRVSIL